MPKVLILIKRRADLTPEQFETYYEQNHVPLISRHLGRFMADYRRSYLRQGPMRLAGTAGADDAAAFDVVTEVWPKDQEAMDQMFLAAGTSPLAEEIAEDESRFVDRDAVVMYVTDERTG